MSASRGAGADVEGAVGGVGLEVDAAARAGVVGAAADRVEGEAGCGRVGGVDLDGGGDGGGVADVVGAGEGVDVAAGGEAVLGGGADEGGGGAEAAAGVGAGVGGGGADEGGGGEAGLGRGLVLGPVGAQPDREGAVLVVAAAATASGGGAVHRQRPTSRRGRVVREGQRACGLRVPCDVSAREGLGRRARRPLRPAERVGVEGAACRGRHGRGRVRPACAATGECRGVGGGRPGLPSETEFVIRKLPPPTTEPR